MSYKDRDKQKEAGEERQRRYKDYEAYSPDPEDNREVVCISQSLPRFDNLEEAERFVEALKGILVGKRE